MYPFIAILAWFSIVILMLGAWLTHVVTCIQNEAWAFLIAGAIAAPIGVVHGVGIWLGAW